MKITLTKFELELLLQIEKANSDELYKLIKELETGALFDKHLMDDGAVSESRNDSLSNALAINLNYTEDDARLAIELGRAYSREAETLANLYYLGFKGKNDSVNLVEINDKYFVELDNAFLHTIDAFYEFYQSLPGGIFYYEFDLDFKRYANRDMLELDKYVEALIMLSDSAEFSKDVANILIVRLDEFPKGKT